MVHGSASRFFGSTARLLSVLGLVMMVVACASAVEVGEGDRDARESLDSLDVDFQRAFLNSSSPSAYKIRGRLVRDWTPEDVSVWMRAIIGFEEYANWSLVHLIDGVTLLEMTESDFESYFPIKNPLHVIKIAGHLRLLQGLCSCREEFQTWKQEAAERELEASKLSIWYQLQHHTRRSCIVGFTALYFPRVAFLQAFFFYPELIHFSSARPLSPNATLLELDSASTERSEERGWYKWLSLAFAVLAPYLLLLYRCLRIIRSNYWAMGVLSAYFLAQGLDELRQHHRMLEMRRLLGLRACFSWRQNPYLESILVDAIIPVAGVIVSFFPVIIAKIAAVLVLLWCSLVVVISFCVIVGYFLQRFAGPEDGEPEKEKKE